jgi:hypothetical protein
MIQQVAMVVFQ